MKKLLLVFLLLLAIRYLAAQSEERPKIGLVLSGGSAHGLAHIGVIKYLEDQGIPIDYVTGTSMGAIIGGLYAMGWSGSDIESFTKTIDWDVIIANALPLDDVAPSEKMLYNKFALNFSVDGGEIKLPEGFFNSLKLDLLMSRLYSGAYDINSFDSLPRPFRCAAVDIETGRVKIFSDGFLGNAIRASMAIPSVFTPKIIDSTVYVDGGLIRNFPAEENKKMGADILIGVYVGGKLESREKLKSLLDILGQSAFMMGILDSENQKHYLDVLIEPDVKDYPSFGFDAADEFIFKGYEAAMKEKSLLDSIKTLVKEYPLKKIKKISNPDFVEISKVDFIEEDADARQLSIFKFGALKTRPYKLKEIDEALTRIYGTQYFDKINYTWNKDATKKKLLVNSSVRDGGKLFANFNYMPTTGVSSILHAEARNQVSGLSVLSATLRISENWAFRTSYNYRLGKRKDFLLLSELKMERFDMYSYSGEINRQNYTATNFSSFVGVAQEPNNDFWAGLKTGLTNQHISPKNQNASGLMSYGRLNFFGHFFTEYNTLNDPAVPDRGWYFGTYLTYNHYLSRRLNSGIEINEAVPSEEDYWLASVSLQRIQTIFPKLVFKGNIQSGYKSSTSFLDNFRIGGLEERQHLSISLLGFHTDQFHFSNYVNVGAEARFEIFKDVYGSIRGDYFEGKRTFNYITDLNPDDELSFWSFGVLGTAITPLGPVKLAYGYNTATKSWQSNFVLGYHFF